MADLDNILIFVKVAQFESITRAARSLGMPISTVSRRLSVLESELGVSLLRRTTRRVTLTAQGREYFSQCQEPLNLLQEADQARIRVELVVTNLLLDLIAENIDVAIRVGELQDSSVVARRLGTSVYYLVAAPEYLKARTLPAEPADLKSHDCVMFNAKNNEREWDLVSGRSKVRVHVSGPAASRDINSARAFVHRGHGIGLLPSTYCDEAIAKGKLIRLLPKWTSSPIPVFALYSSRKFLPLRMSVFLEALAGWKGPLWIKD